MNKLETSEISKTYRGRRVVDDVSVFVQQGEVVGLPLVPMARQDHVVLHHRRLDQSGLGPCSGGRRGYHRAAYVVRARKGHSYLPQEAFGVSQDDRGGKNLLAILETLPMRAQERREKMDRLIGPARPGNRAAQPGLHAIRRRAAARGDSRVRW